MIVWFIFIAFEIARNWYIIERSKARPNYLISFIFRGMAAIAHGIMLDVSNPDEWWPVLIFQVTSFFVLFSPILNIIRGKDFDYLGETSGWLDKIGLKRPAIYWSAYGICLFIFIYFLSILLRIY